MGEQYRQEALNKAGEIISGERDVQYGAPEDNLGRIGKLWSVLFGIEISASDVAMAMVLLKAGRYVNKAGFQPDTWTDVAGYGAIGYEVEKLANEK